MKPDSTLTPARCKIYSFKIIINTVIMPGHGDGPIGILLERGAGEEFLESSRQSVSHAAGREHRDSPARRRDRLTVARSDTEIARADRSGTGGLRLSPAHPRPSRSSRTGDCRDADAQERPCAGRCQRKHVVVSSAGTDPDVSRATPGSEGGDLPSRLESLATRGARSQRRLCPHGFGT